MSDEQDAELHAWARSSDLEDRFRAADVEPLPDDVALVLLRDPDDQVVMSVLANRTTSRAVLDECSVLLSSVHREQLVGHPNAPFALAEELPLWKHTFVSITSYCEGKGLGEAVRDRIAHAWADAEPGNGITLAEAVDAAR